MNKYVLIFFLLSFGVKNLISQQDSLLFFKNNFAKAERLESGELAYKIANTYGIAYPDSGLIWINRAYEIAIARKDIALQKRALVARSRFEFWNETYEQSIVTGLKAEELLEIYPDDKLKLPLLYQLAEGYEFSGGYERGVATYERCYDLAEKIKDAVMLSKLDIKMGNLRQVAGDFGQALSYYQKAVRRLDKNNPNTIISYYRAVHEYYDLALKEPEFVSGEILKEICGNVTAEFDEITEKAESLSALFTDLKIRCLLQNGSEEHLKTIVLPSIRGLETVTTNPAKLQQQLDLFSTVALRQKRIKEAARYNERSRQLAKLTKNLSLKINSLEISKQIAEKKEDYKTAFELGENLKKIEQKLAEKDRTLHIRELETKIVGERKRTEDYAAQRT